MIILSDQRSIAEARSSLPRLVRQAESGRAVVLTRRGERVAVLIGRKQYERLVSRSRRFSEAWDDFTREVHLRELDIDPDEVFAGTREDTAGRDGGL